MSILTKIAANLRAIEDMQARLELRACDLAGDPHMPGGDAMVSLAPVANLVDWARRNDLADDALAPFEDPDELWPPFQLLRFWSESLRADLGMDYDDPRWQPTLRSEAAFLRNPDVLAHIEATEPHIEELAADVARARRKLEDILREGMRSDRSRVVCPDCEPDDARPSPRLVRVYGAADHDDRWKCPTCKRRFDDEDFNRAYAKQLRSMGAQRCIPARDAISVLISQGVPRATAYRWVAEVADAPESINGVWWPHLWTRHLSRLGAQMLA